MSDYWRDYTLKRPGTLGGEQALLESARANRPALPSAPTGPDFPVGPRPPRAARKLTKLDFVVGFVVFLTAWGALLNSNRGDVWGAAAVAFFAGGIATWWWRHVIVIAIVGVALWLYFQHK